MSSPRKFLNLFALVLAALAVLAASASAHGHGAPSHLAHGHGAPSHPSHGHGAPSHHPGHPPHPGGGQPEPDPLSAGPLMATIDQYGSSANHYSGTPASWSELNVVAQQFGADGLQVG